MRSLILSAVLSVGLAGVAAAQTPTPVPATMTASPEALQLAREIVNKTAGDRTSTLASVGGPMVGMMQQMGARDQAQAQALVSEVIMPLLSDHYDELIDLQAHAYADALSIDDLKATSTFYNTKAGADLIAAGPKLAQSRLQLMGQWISGMQPEMNTKMRIFMQAHPDK